MGEKDKIMMEVRSKIDFLPLLVTDENTHFHIYIMKFHLRSLIHVARVFQKTIATDTIFWNYLMS